MTSYGDLLKDPRWQRMRLEVMQRADFHCEACGTDKVMLNVHHTYYRKGRAPWEYDPASLKCWCAECHQKHHKIPRSKKNGEVAVSVVDDSDICRQCHASFITDTDNLCDDCRCLYGDAWFDSPSAVAPSHS